MHGRDSWGGWTRIQRFFRKVLVNLPWHNLRSDPVCTASWGLAKQELQTERFQYPFHYPRKDHQLTMPATFQHKGLLAAARWLLQTPGDCSLNSNPSNLKGLQNPTWKKQRKQGLIPGKSKRLLFLCSDPKECPTQFRTRFSSSRSWHSETPNAWTRMIQYNCMVWGVWGLKSCHSFIILWPSPPVVSRALKLAQVEGNEQWNTGQTRKTVSSS